MRKTHDQLQADIDLPIRPLLIAITVSLAVLYLSLHYTFGLPSIVDILIGMAGALLGEGTKERLQLLLGLGVNGAPGAASVVARVRARANSLLGGGMFGGDGEETVGGLWNMGNTCYQNSVLQAMASLKYLKPHLAILSTPEALDDEELHPAVALADLFQTLNTPSKTRRTLNVPNVIKRVDASTSGWMYNEQQDAQEFFQKVTAAVEKEVSRYWARRRPVTGLESVGLLFGSSEERKEKEKQGAKEVEETVKEKIMPEELKNPFEGLSAQRVGCLRCEYVEAIRLQTFTSLSLSLPSTYECTLEECLHEYTVIERIEQVECDKCTLLTQKRKLESLLNSPNNASRPSGPSPSPQELNSNITEVQVMIRNRLNLVEEALAQDDFTPVTFSQLSIPPRKVTATKTKQTMIARPPPILVLHLNRSQFDMISGVTRKNFAAVSFPLVLNVGGVVTSVEGMEIDPGKPISSGIEEGNEAELGGLLYELKSVITHYGGHHNGHYICYRKYRKRWWKISDEMVTAVSVREVRDVGNAFMLFYERIPVEEARAMIERRRKDEEMRRMTEERSEEAELALALEGEGKGVPVHVMKPGAILSGLKGMGGRRFGTDSDVDAILRADGDEILKGLLRNKVVQAETTNAHGGGGSASRRAEKRQDFDTSEENATRTEEDDKEMNEGQKVTMAMSSEGHEVDRLSDGKVQLGEEEEEEEETSSPPAKTDIIESLPSMSTVLDMEPSTTDDSNTITAGASNTLANSLDPSPLSNIESASLLDSASPATATPSVVTNNASKGRKKLKNKMTGNGIATTGTGQTQQQQQQQQQKEGNLVLVN